jgi:23S rRNA-/tRNA-specific pseudouridylate synthase
VLKGKPAVSEFKLIWKDEKRNVSLIQCFPRTGRTHQLRVHLTHIGHGIVGDPLYGPDAKNADLDVVDSLGNTKATLFLLRVVVCSRHVQEDYQAPGELCKECGDPSYEGKKRKSRFFFFFLSFLVIFSDPTLFRIHLHALRYTCKDFEFAVPMPEWAKRD